MSRASRLTSLILLAALAAGACGRERSGAASAHRADPAAPNPRTWRATDTSVGPVVVGMTLAEANEVLAGLLASTEALDSNCDFVSPHGVAADVSYMVVDSEIARIDVRDSLVATAAGARVGDSEARLRTLYGKSLLVRPHHYLPAGHYLTVSTPMGEDTLETVFETDGKRVTEYRVGRKPEVEWIEGCG